MSEPVQIPSVSSCAHCGRDFALMDIFDAVQMAKHADYCYLYGRGSQEVTKDAKGQG
jgi:hypothetical protein